MTKNFKVSGIIIAFFLCLFYQHSVRGQEVSFPNPDVTISMDLQDANVKDVLKVFSIQSGLNFIASEGVQDRKITLYLDRVPIQQAMDQLFKANGLYYELNEDSNVFIVKDWGKPTVETVTKVFYLKYASVKSSALMGQKGLDAGFQGLASTASTTTSSTTSSDKSGITQAIEQLLSDKGKVIEDGRTNSLIVTDIPSKIPGITQLVAALDVQQPQVMLEVEMLDVSKNVIDRMGFKMQNGTPLINPLTVVFPGKNGGNLFFGNPALREGTIETAGIAGSVIFGKTYAALLDFLRSQTDTKYLARPRILTLNNETAKIEITTKEAVGEKQSTTGSTGTTTTVSEAERYDTGVSLTVTPQINLDTNEITMYIVPSVAEASRSGITSSSGVPFYNPEVRSTKSVVRVKNGETIILGGLIRNQLTQTIDKVPILGNLPILGALFRHKDKSKDEDRELLIFITPRIMRDTGSSEFAKAKNSNVLTEREQDAFEGRSRQTAINASLNSYERRGKIE